MAPRKINSNMCCVCGKKKTSYPGIRLHMFPRDARRRMEWFQRINIAYENNIRAICDDHFDDCYRGSKGRLFNNAVPRLADGLNENQHAHHEDGVATKASLRDFQAECTLLDAPPTLAEDSLLQIDFSAKIDPNFQNQARFDFPVQQDVLVRCQETFQIPPIMNDTSEKENPDIDAATILPSVVYQQDHTYASISDTAENIEELISPWRVRIDLDIGSLSMQDYDLYGEEFSYSHKDLSENKVDLSYDFEDEESDFNVYEEDYLKMYLTDSEDSLEADNAFWEKMRAYAKRRIKKASKNKSFIKSGQKNNLYQNKRKEFNSNTCELAISKNNNLLSVKENKMSSEVSCSTKEFDDKDDWITDVEVDKEDCENFDAAFQKEWIEKRRPINSIEKNFSCEICGKAYSKNDFLRSHIVRKHKEYGAKKYPYFCQHCHKVYASSDHLLKHQNKFNGPCEICGIVPKCYGVFRIHRKNHDIKPDGRQRPLPRKKCHCSECPKEFSSEYLKKRHITKKHPTAGQTKYQCDKCRYSSVTDVDLKIHYKRAHGSKLDIFTCKECKDIFYSALHYENHVTSCNTKAKMICLLCCQRFLSEEELQTHICIHEVTNEVDRVNETSERENPIEISTNFVSSYDSLYICGVCNVTLSNPEELDQHFLKYHNVNAESPTVLKLL